MVAHIAQWARRARWRPRTAGTAVAARGRVDAGLRVPTPTWCATRAGPEPARARAWAAYDRALGRGGRGGDRRAGQACATGSRRCATSTAPTRAPTSRFRGAGAARQVGVRVVTCYGASGTTRRPNAARRSGELRHSRAQRARPRGAAARQLGVGPPRSRHGAARSRARALAGRLPIHVELGLDLTPGEAGGRRRLGREPPAGPVGHAEAALRPARRQERGAR